MALCFDSPESDGAYKEFRGCLERLLVAQLGFLCSDDDLLARVLDRAFSDYREIFRQARRANVNYPSYFAGVAFAILAESMRSGSMEAFWRDLLGGDPGVDLEDSMLRYRLNVLLFMGIGAMSRCCRAYFYARCVNSLNSREVISDEAFTLGCPDMDTRQCRRHLRSMVRAALGLGSGRRL
jgi:hypothetical protein